MRKEAVTGSGEKEQNNREIAADSEGARPFAELPVQIGTIQTRIANEKYLRTHKEVSLLISGFFRRDDFVLIFIPDYFTDPRLPNKIHMQLIKDKKGD
ncbi:hypothetical protein A6R68_18409 [Neotoma lepida]|uniref:Uncharacterized protein n=1 Tax=Neotoma lepida TaxID=56216 RepID=A0A1A6HLT1_NEOLE|nr:hypothetical protein A6R68_18409 [Neotoma lepida]